jgi:DNA-directed RNA polymerase subunit F
MIKTSRPITMAETLELSKNSEKFDSIKNFIKNFNILDYDKAKNLTDELRSLNILKLKESHIVKIVDFIPQNIEDINKIILDVSFDADEVNKILGITKNHIQR